MSMRRALAVRTVIVLALAAGVVALVAGPASAHAELLQSAPAPGAVLERAPREVKLSFTESVEVADGAIRVFDADGARVDEGGVEASGRTVSLPLAEVDDGSYVVTWRVTSSDAHPIRGAFTFQVGQGGAGATSREVQGLADRLLSEQGGDQVVGTLYGIARFLVFAGLALLIGGAIFAVAIWPPAQAFAGARRVVKIGWAATVIGTLAGLLLYGPYAEGLGLGDTFSASLLGDTLGVRFGQVWLARLILVLATAPLLFLMFRRDPANGEPRPLPTWWRAEMAVFAVIVAATPGLAGHATTGDWATAAVVADTIHVLAMAVWLGGLVALSVVGLGRNAPIEARDGVERFSRVALGCVIALVATGAFQTWRQVGSLEALRTTDYGRLLVIKLVLVALVIVFAAFSREVVLRLLPPRELHRGLPVVAGGSDDEHADRSDEPTNEEEASVGGARIVRRSESANEEEASVGGARIVRRSESTNEEEAELRRLRRSVWVEIVTAAAILSVTTLLVNTAPAKTAVATAAQGGVTGTTLRGDKVSVDVTLTPGVAGANDVHVDTSDASGAPKDVDEVTVTFALPDRGIAPIDVPLRRLGPGHYYSPGFQVPLSGEWRVEVKPLLSEFEQPTLRGTFEVG